LSQVLFKAELYKNSETGESYTKVYPIEAVRGNSVYANREAPRREQAVKDIGLNSGQCLFITLTTSYDLKNPLESWLRVKGEVSKFTRRMKKLGMVNQIRAVEANTGGGCHLHVLVDMGRKLPYYCGRSKRGQEVYRLSDRKLFEQIKQTWPIGFVDIQVVKDSGAGGYLLKELSKYNSYEDSLRRVQTGEYTKVDIKRLYTHYYADKAGMRLFTVSKGLKKCAVEECKNDLINNKIKSTGELLGFKKVCSLTFSCWPGGVQNIPKYGIYKPGSSVYEQVYPRLLEALGSSELTELTTYALKD
jgi:hypothetical protein